MTRTIEGLYVSAAACGMFAALGLCVAHYEPVAPVLAGVRGAVLGAGLALAGGVGLGYGYGRLHRGRDTAARPVSIGWGRQA